MSDIVWSIDPRRDDLGDVIARLRAFGSDVLEPRGVRWTCEGPPEAFDRELGPEQRRQLYLICKEAIHNIARHSRAQNVTLRIELQGNAVRCDIQDDGCGLSFGDREGLGIGSMHRRAASLGGEFHISPRPEGGTQASLHFPLHARNA
jgi:signal transduction histidine kinase